MAVGPGAGGERDEPKPVCLGGLVVPRPAIVGILNVTPDSFSDGGTLASPTALIERAQALVAGGATVLDVGGESTRPGFVPVSVAEELRRVVPAVRALAAARLGVALSVDTRRSEVADAALRAGAHVVNDVSALQDPQMAATVRRHDAVLVLAHGFVAPHQPAPPPASGEVDAVVAALLARRDEAERQGIVRDQLWLDPGLGFGKTTAQNLALVAQLGRLTTLGCAVMVAPSRKRFLGEVTGIAAPAARDAATAACCALAVALGAELLRVHEPAAVRDAVGLAAAVRRARFRGPP